MYYAFSAIDMDSCQAQLEAAEENGIPVIVLDSGVKTGNVNATCVVDNYQAGVQAAVKLARYNRRKWENSCDDACGKCSELSGKRAGLY